MPRCGYHNARKREPSKRSRANEQLLDQMIAIHSHRHTRRYGSPRMTCELRALGIACSENRVARIMRSRACELVPGVLSPEDYPAQSRGPSFAQSDIRRVSFSSACSARYNITYIPTREGWLYLAIVIDLFFRAISAGTFRLSARRSGRRCHHTLHLLRPRAPGSNLSLRHHHPRLLVRHCLERITIIPSPGVIRYNASSLLVIGTITF